VASFESDQPLPSDLRHRLDAVTPREIAVRSVEQASAGFDARRDARSRTYCYRVLAQRLADPFERGRALYWPYGLDRGALDACAASAVGKHDFTAFTPTETDHVHFQREVIRCAWAEASGLGGGQILELWIEADAFMRSMVRVVVGTMLEIGCGRRPRADFEALLEGAPRNAAGETAPAHGLYLAGVTY
jgi:tRNA pseudouridine38-40 synthase